jgi:hypothetical protein
MSCPWKIHWGTVTSPVDEFTTACGFPAEHIGKDPGTAGFQHRGEHPNPAAPAGFTVITWMAGDRREFTGDWPGYCAKTPGCTLHAGHHGRCAP